MEKKSCPSAVTIQKPEVNSFTSFTTRPNLHGNVSVKFYWVILNTFKNMSYLAHSARGALQIFILILHCYSEHCVRIRQFSNSIRKIVSIIVNSICTLESLINDNIGSYVLHNLYLISLRGVFPLHLT